ncbi:hypothetical protein D3C76_1779650 [compost metagenome]
MPPILVTSFCCRILNSLACNSNGISPISSNKIVPLLASSNNPAFPDVLAPVKAPFSYPKSSDSMRLAGIAEQFTLI